MARKQAYIISQVIAVVLCFCAAGVFAQAQWGYFGNIGPGKWGQLDPAFTTCAVGKLQSPINISKKFQLAPYALKIHYQPTPMHIINDGDTNLIMGGSPINIQHGYGMQLNFPLSGPKETITFQGKNYHLIQFHVHTPSETAFNNQTFPMEIHFIHQSNDGQVVIIAVLAKAGEANPELQRVINYFPTESRVERVINNEKINLSGLLPAKQDYYNFTGSLTLPPCTEGVQWIVMSDFITASPAQVLLFRKAVRGDNARPIQSDHKRDVYFSKEPT